MKIILALALILSTPVLAATVDSVSDTSQPNQFNLVAQNDAVCFDHYYGTKWATVRWQVTVAGSGAITTEYSKDMGTNFLPAAYSAVTSVVSANPSTAGWTNVAPVVASYETPIGANTTNFCVRYQTAGTATTVVLTPGLPYVPGVPVVATLYDVTEGSIGAGLTQTLDVSGWAAVDIQFKTPTTQVWAFTGFDDAGAAVGPNFVTTAGSNSRAVLGPNAATNLSATVASGAFAAYPFRDKRFAMTLPAGGTVSTGRARVTASR